MLSNAFQCLPMLSTAFQCFPSQAVVLNTANLSPNYPPTIKLLAFVPPMFPALSTSSGRFPNGCSKDTQNPTTEGQNMGQKHAIRPQQFAVAAPREKAGRPHQCVKGVSHSSTARWFTYVYPLLSGLIAYYPRKKWFIVLQ